ncbi:MAG: AAA family ATPase [Thermoanaerobaculia bacterium]|nr:AAA family ATPase [Thermoanaerobaculia bacterium]
MFREFFGFREKPFGKTPNPAYLYESPHHREALARLEYAIEEKELALLYGDVGSGKTTLSRALIDRIAGARPVILIINPTLSPAQLLRSIASGFGLTPKHHRADLLDQIYSKLYELYEERREPVLIIDEAQLIPKKATFEEIRLLTNFQLDDENLLSIVLIGQPELKERLSHKAYRALRQRIGIQYSLRSLSEEETAHYVNHRIRVAGGSVNPFTMEAMSAMFRCSEGIPRVINTLATTALLDAYGDESSTIDAGRILAAAREHGLDGGQG